MQYIENDMDDLFRRAAANYPLEHGKGDWESVLKRISKETTRPEMAWLPGKKDYKKYIPIAALLLIATGAFFITYNNRHKEPRGIASSKREQTINRSLKGVLSIKKQNALTAFGNVDSIRIDKKIIPSSTTHQVTVTDNLFGLQDFNKEKTAGNSNAGSVKSTKRNAADQTTLIDSNDIVIDIPQRMPNYSSSIIGSKETVALKPLTVMPQHLVEITTKVAAPLIRQEQKGGYAGFGTGPDFSKGSSMSFTSGGFDAGIILGYRFSNHLSFESGISWLTKTYRSQGKNFNMKKIAAVMPVGMVINDLESSSSMIEIPLKIKYDLNSSEKAGLFLTGGISSYIITKEYNQYNVTLNGQPEKLTGMYKKNSYEFPAAAVFSAGYEQHISKRIHVRIEPFLKWPLQGIGIGSLPVTTAGLQFAITSQLN